MSYRIVSRFYAYEDDMGESYTLISDGNEEDTNLKVGSSVHIIEDDVRVGHKDGSYDIHRNFCKKCGYITYGGFSYCPWCGKKYRIKRFGVKKNDKQE